MAAAGPSAALGSGLNGMVTPGEQAVRLLVFLKARQAGRCAPRAWRKKPVRKRIPYVNE